MPSPVAAASTTSAAPAGPWVPTATDIATAPASVVAISPAVRAAFDAFTRPRRLPYTDEEIALLDTAERRDFAFQGQALVTWTWGRRGPRLLLVHGWESRASHWHAWIQPLVQAGFQVTAIDNLAHGHASGDMAHVLLWGQGLVEVSRQLGPIHAVIAHSVGSAASLYAFAHGLTVNASIHIAGPSSLRRVAQGFVAAAGLPPAELPAFNLLIEEALRQPIDTVELPALQVGLRHPALIIHDREDKEVPFTESLALSEAWPLAQLVPVEGLGHRRILRAPEVIARALSALT